MITGCTSQNASDNTQPVEPVDTIATESPKVVESKEERVYSIVKEINIAEKMKEILPLIANINWHTYNETSGEQTMELIEFLCLNQKYIDTAHFPNIILATKGLDGAWSESFSSIVGVLFTRDRDEFIKALADTVDLGQKKKVIEYIAYNLRYQDVKPIIEELKQLSTNEEVSSGEREVIKALIQNLERPY